MKTKHTPLKIQRRKCPGLAQICLLDSDGVSLARRIKTPSTTFTVLLNFSESRRLMIGITGKRGLLPRQSRVCHLL